MESNRPGAAGRFAGLGGAGTGGVAMTTSKITNDSLYRTVCVDGRGRAGLLVREAKRKGWTIKAVGDNCCYCIVLVPIFARHVLERQVQRLAAKRAKLN